LTDPYQPRSQRAWVGQLATIGTIVRGMKRLRDPGLLLALALVVVASALAATLKRTGQDGVTRHAIGRLAAALRKDGLMVEQPARLYAGLCPQLLPRRRSDGYTILVSSSRTCDAAMRRKKTLTHVRGRKWVFATRFDNILLLHVLADQKMTAKSQALVGLLEVFAVIDD
jgi:hypothetical protein